MGSQEALLAGASIGLAIAAPIGPMAVIVVRRTLVGGFLAGITTGAGASTIHLVYATLAVCGINQVAAQFQSNRRLIDLVVAAALAIFAVKMMRQRTARPNIGAPVVRSLTKNYASALALCLVNPMTFALLLSAIAAVAEVSNQLDQTSSLALGVFAGSITWWICLVSATSLIGVRFSPRSMRMIDVLAGAVMFALAVSMMLSVL